MKNLLWWVVFTIGAVLWVDISLAEPQWAQNLFNVQLMKKLF